MKNKIIAINKAHLAKLIENEIKINGYNCDLNHINVSKITDMSLLFNNSHFNGDISNWDVSSVTDMSLMFSGSKFNGDISKWNVSNVKSMSLMFSSSIFNGEISQWNVSSLKSMTGMFNNSKFMQDLSDWKPYKLKPITSSVAFMSCDAPIPYWYNIIELGERKNAIDSYSLDKGLMVKNESNKRLKI